MSTDGTCMPSWTGRARPPAITDPGAVALLIATVWCNMIECNRKGRGRVGAAGGVG